MLMNWLSLVLIALGLLDPKIKATTDALKLVEIVNGIRSADYRGERAELRRLEASLEQVNAKELLAYREYWRGFARWRRAINGFNEAPTPADLREDLEGCMERFRAALVRKPDWIEAKLGVAGCGANMLYLARDDPKWRETLLAEFLPVWRDITENGQENPRVLWLVGGSQLSAPPPVGGDPLKAVATYQRGLKAARAEGLRVQAERPPDWEPTWGAAEHLMSLAYVYSHTTLTDRDLAQSYAEGTLALVPDWHYVRDIMLPQIEALPPRAR
jgi:hypothetical protein